MHRRIHCQQINGHAIDRCSHRSEVFTGCGADSGVPVRQANRDGRLAGQHDG